MFDVPGRHCVFLRSISRSTGTGDFEFFTFFNIFPLYWGLWVFHVFFIFPPCTGDFEFFTFFSHFLPVLETLRFSRFLTFFPCTGVFEFFTFFKIFPCTGDFEFFTFFHIFPLYWRLWVWAKKIPIGIFPCTGDFEFFHLLRAPEKKNVVNYCLFQFLCNFGIHKFCAYSTPKICGFRFLSFVLDLYTDEEWL